MIDMAEMIEPHAQPVKTAPPVRCAFDNSASFPQPAAKRHVPFRDQRPDAASRRQRIDGSNVVRVVGLHDIRRLSRTTGIDYDRRHVEYQRNYFQDIAPVCTSHAHLQRDAVPIDWQMLLRAWFSPISRLRPCFIAATDRERETDVDDSWRQVELPGIPQLGWQQPVKLNCRSTVTVSRGDAIRTSFLSSGGRKGPAWWASSRLWNGSVHAGSLIETQARLNCQPQVCRNDVSNMLRLRVFGYSDSGMGWHKACVDKIAPRCLRSLLAFGVAQ